MTTIENNAYFSMRNPIFIMDLPKNAILTIFQFPKFPTNPKNAPSPPPVLGHWLAAGARSFLARMPRRRAPQAPFRAGLALLLALERKGCLSTLPTQGRLNAHRRVGLADVVFGLFWSFWLMSFFVDLGVFG